MNNSESNIHLQLLETELHRQQQQNAILQSKITAALEIINNPDNYFVPFCFVADELNGVFNSDHAIHDVIYPNTKNRINSALGLIANFPCEKMNSTSAICGLIVEIQCALNGVPLFAIEQGEVS